MKRAHQGAAQPDSGPQGGVSAASEAIIPASDRPPAVTSTPISSASIPEAALPKAAKSTKPPATTTPPALTEFWPKWKFHLLGEALTEG
jgi:hypothetical protein